MVPQTLCLLVEEHESVLVENSDRCKGQDLSLYLTAVHGSQIGARSVGNGDVVVTKVAIGYLDAGKCVERIGSG